MTDQKNDLIERWVEALRSGEYEQGQRKLRSHDDQYCPLGVLCDLVDPDGWNKGGEAFVAHRDLTHSPGLRVQKELEAALGPKWTKDPFWDTDDWLTSLMDLNDAKGWTFEQIADALEQDFLND
ncbi:hypothetical protein [Candidatus Poriferisocius sp.]|uniref:hypothetical protein n=1 Tax=Candidatus Poriferisocius sp. TaxID=3101276 RepID=UPI003B52A2D6